MKRSICEYFYEPEGVEGHDCGYCKGKNTSVSNGMWAHQLTCEDYQDLIDRGWRRSGKYCYKPVMDRTCCPLYAIRCEAAKFQISKSQKKVLKTMNDYLAGKNVEGASKPADSKASQKKEEEVDHVEAASKGDSSTKKHEGTKREKVVRPGTGADPTKPPCRKAKVIRQERKQQKLAAAKGTKEATGSEKPTKSKEAKDKSQAEASDTTPDFLKIGPDGRKPLEMFLTQPSADGASQAAHKLEIALIRSHPPSPEFTTTYKESYQLFQKYQMAVHREPEDKCDEKMYKRFLCDSPLIKVGGVSGWSCDYGSYHQQYRIDGKLVAVGVLDILPKCLSSVYVFYDPDYDFLTLGVYTALRELELVRNLLLSNPDHFKYYCMGYYVHQCQKMRYKGQYYPSFLLCPVTYRYVPIERCKPKLDVSRFSKFFEENFDPENVEDWLGKTLVLYQQNLFSYEIFKMLIGSEYEDKVKEYAGFVGPNVASRMVLYLN